MLCTTKADEFDIVISDFGLAKRLVPGMEITTPCGTSGYVGNVLSNFFIFFFYILFLFCSFYYLCCYVWFAYS